MADKKKTVNNPEDERDESKVGNVPDSADDKGVDETLGTTTPDEEEIVKVGGLKAHLAEDGGIDLVEVLELVEYHCEMTFLRLAHDHIEKVAEVRQLPIDLYAQLLFEGLLEFPAKESFAVFRHKEIGKLLPLKGFHHQRGFAHAPPARQHREHGILFRQFFVLLKDDDFLFPVVEFHNVNLRLYKYLFLLLIYY